MSDWDVLIVGRSYAGLSAALTLGRARRSVLVVGTGGPRNESVGHVHGFLAQDHVPPADVIAAAEAQLERYPNVQLVDSRVTEITKTDDGFRALLGDRPTTAEMVILATGVNDNPPAIPGLAEHWGRGVFTCPYCDGFEHADLPIGVMGAPMFVGHLGKLLTGWSDRVTLFDRALDSAVQADFEAHGVTVEPRPIVEVIGDGSRISSVRLEDGTVVALEALFVGELPAPNNQLATALGCAVDEMGFVVVDTQSRTNVDGVWAVGDLTSLRASMALAVASGVVAATQLNMTLVERRW